MRIKEILAIIIPLAVITALLANNSFSWDILFTTSQPDPPKPEITYGVFPFRLEYEIDGEIVVVEDTLICEYDGVGWNEGVGKHRKWKESLASGNKEVLLLQIDDTKSVYYSVGNSKYYMGDEKKYTETENTETENTEIEYTSKFNHAYVVEIDGRITRTSMISDSELLKRYGIKLISWDYTKPIVNIFN